MVYQPGALKISVTYQRKTVASLLVSRLADVKMLRLSEAAIISTTMEALLFGFSVLMFILTLWILLRNRVRQRPNYALVISACVLEVLALGELINNIVRVWQGLLTDGPSTPGGSDMFFADVRHATFVIKGCLYNLQTLILDGVVIYRTYKVWNHFYVVILPVLGWFGLLASAIGANSSFVLVTENTSDVFAGAVGKWITAVYSLTLGTNLSASILLAYRVWKVDHDARKYKAENRLRPVLHAVIESGALYSATIIAALMCFVTGNTGVYVILDMISPIICIVFNMIILQVGIASGKLFPSVLGSSRPQTTSNEHGRPGEHRHGRPYGSDAYQLKSLAVEVTRYVETDGDTASVSGADRKVAPSMEDADDVTPSKPSPGFAV